MCGSEEDHRREKIGKLHRTAGDFHAALQKDFLASSLLYFLTSITQSPHHLHQTLTLTVRISNGL
jgi:hypothetical protein